jgi:ArsR family transcriptional regulator
VKVGFIRIKEIAMPALDAEIVRMPVKTAINIGLDPAQNVVNMLILMQKVEHLPGVNEWITETVAALSPELQHTGRVVMLGLHYAVKPTRRWSSFPAFVDHLASREPESLRDQMFYAYENLCCQPKAEYEIGPDKAMTSQEAYLGYLRERFDEEHIDEQIELEAYALMKNPPAMREAVVSYLRTMWDEVLQVEWERNEPLLQACVDAFQQVDFSDQSPIEVAETIVGQELPEKYRSLLEKEYEQVVFVPSAHLGPYRGLFEEGQRLWLLFGARPPEGSTVSSPDLSRSELLVRLSALADDTRLSILHSLKEHGELCSRDIMQQLDLSQSAASRHLKQLSATGYLTERRKNGAKCYRMNEERVENTVEALSHFLLG